jgi:tetratricopeptide (TPR) repeat protein
MDTRISARDCYERGRTLRQSKLYRQALEDFQRATHDPYYTGQAHTQIGLCLRAMGRHDDAITALRYALNSPSLSLEEVLHVHYLLADSLEALGRSAEALEAYNAIRQEDPAFLDVDARIKRLCGVAHTFLTRGWLRHLCSDLLARMGKR